MDAHQHDLHREIHPVFIVKHIALFLFVFCVPTSWATTYYVATDGNDGNGGTDPATDAWLTIQHAADTMTAGDTVIVSTGTYNERVTSAAAGSSGNPITFQGSSSVTNKGFGIAHNYITVDGFVITGEPNAYPNEYGAVYIDDDADNVTLQNMLIYDLDAGFHAVNFKYTEDPALGSQDCVISNCTFYGSSGKPMIATFGQNHLVVDNVLSNGQDGFHVWGYNITIRSNTINTMGGPYSQANGGGHPDLIQSFNDANDRYASNIVFEGNTCVDGSPSGPTYGESQLCQLTDDGGYEKISDFTFRNNLFVRMGMAGNVGIPRAKWYNNTFIDCATNTAHALLINASVANNYWATDCEVKNNVFLRCGNDDDNTSKGWVQVFQALVDLIDTSEYTYVQSYNYIGGSNYAAKVEDLTGEGDSFIEPTDINGGNPYFVNEDSDDYRPTVTSLLSNAGATLSGFSTDMVGSNRASGALMHTNALFDWEEGWENSGSPEKTWTETDPSNAWSVSSAQVFSGDYALQIESVAGTQVYGLTDLGESLSSFYLRFYFYIPSPNTTNSQQFFWGTDSASYHALSTFAVKVGTDNSGSAEVHWSSLPASGDTTSVSSNEWHRLDAYVENGGTSTCMIDGAVFTTQASNEYDTTYFQVGANDTKAQDVYFDDVAVSKTGWIRGISKYDTAWDIGAYEYSGAAGVNGESVWTGTWNPTTDGMRLGNVP